MVAALGKDSDGQYRLAYAEHMIGLIAPSRAFAGALGRRFGFLALTDQVKEPAKAFVLKDSRLSLSKVRCGHNLIA